MVELLLPKQTARVRFPSAPPLRRPPHPRRVQRLRHHRPDSHRRLAPLAEPQVPERGDARVKRQAPLEVQGRPRDRAEHPEPATVGRVRGVPVASTAGEPVRIKRRGNSTAVSTSHAFQLCVRKLPRRDGNTAVLCCTDGHDNTRRLDANVRGDKTVANSYASNGGNVNRNTMRSETGNTRQNDAGNARTRLVQEANRGNREREARDQRALFAAAHRSAF